MGSNKMAIDLGTLGDGILRALLEDDASKRREAAVAWKDAVLSVVQKALPDVLSTYVQTAMDNWSKINDSYRREVLTNDLAQHTNYHLLLTLRTTSRDPRQEEGRQPVMGAPAQVVGGSSSGPTHLPNDDRSDSLNPNNEAYRAATDNRANQLNPNNPAYHSSRGQGRR